MLSLLHTEYLAIFQVNPIQVCQQDGCNEVRFRRVLLPPPIFSVKVHCLRRLSRLRAIGDSTAEIWASASVYMQSINVHTNSFQTAQVHCCS